ncbi:hypothetical protein CON65_22415 [Bacillus pseudomycoides]|uniref:DUF456 domain-containing protein n=1 Tax=Bacillus pseudomycoides TaxID=64104 RepID=A0AA91V8F5_9BACI|nr:MULTISPECIES: DUF456 family protein [Bacillus]PEB54299.1 hypothetical protein COO03_05960 [Bacillus sp. AFS098217]PED80452.1 hypothetical protein CON65_22415 [Bacillus pseudomycoides]PEU11197.1 hypothetical protein CN525_22720 [Bacillus sp. AFS014408]PEU13062.1 hypothetical protein CN524_11970 [Bacillus sp. AFS019443]PFW61963.1 hypothetical protein COL20_15340 [Bacillus sp. AFS075034]
MTVLLTLCIISCFIVSFIAFIYPIIPGILALWAGYLIYHFGINAEELTTSFWIIQIIFTIIIFIADFIANGYFLKKYGSTKWGERVGMISIIVGSFFFPPFGLIIIPFLSVFITEIMHKKTPKEAFMVGIATVVGFLSSTVAKAILQIIMIIIFICYIIF